MEERNRHSPRRPSSDRCTNALLWVTLIPAMAAATADSLFGVLGTVVYVVMIVGATWALANRSFALIHALPDRVGRWFGVGGIGHGDEHGHVEGIAGVAKAGGSQGSSILRKAIQGDREQGGGKPGAAGKRPSFNPAAAERAASDRTAALLSDVGQNRPRVYREPKGEGAPA